jgi:UDP-3-O-[3-hydroxymyristoyl] glucosamine N-acyltransferase
VPDPYLGFIHLLEHFFPQQPPTWGIDARAVIDPDVALGACVNIGPYAVICRGVRLGDNVTVYPGTYIGEGCEIGADCILAANVSLYHMCTWTGVVSTVVLLLVLMVLALSSPRWFIS